MVAVRLAIADEDVVVLGGILHGYDGLASLHAERSESGEIVLLTPEGRRRELESLLAELEREIPFARRH